MFLSVFMPLPQKGLRSSREKTREDDEGSDEETNATEERGRRWLMKF